MQAITTTNCASGNHVWANTGLFIAGKLCIPCQNPTCAAYMRREPIGWIEIDNGFPMVAAGIPLSIQDHPRGGVAKIVCREITDSPLSAIPFVPGDVAIDIGAHVGIVSIYLAKAHPDIRVISFEPEPDNFARFLANIQANNVSNITPLNKAVTADGRDITLHGDPTTNTGGFTSILSNKGEPQVVPSMPLARIFQDYSITQCRLLKIDCEGCEYEILPSAVEQLRKVEYLWGEFHADPQLTEQGCTPKTLLKLCRQYIPYVSVAFSGKE